MIAVFINSLTSGGAEKVVLTLIEQFKKIPQSLDLILIEKEQFYELPENIPTTYLTQYDSLEKGFLKMPYLFVCAYRLKKQITKSGQVVQSHLLRASFINVIAKWMGGTHHAQIVVHSRINFEHLPFYKRWPAKWIYKQIFNRADSIVSICEVMKMELDEYLGLKNHPAHKVIYNPHNLSEIQYKARQTIKGFVFSDQKKYIISVGRIVKGKRLYDLIKAFARIDKTHPQTELILLGDGDLRNELEKFTHDLAIDQKVHFLGFQQNPYAYLAKSDIMVLSSEWEGLPNILIESMACGTPVISSDCISGPREIIHPDSDLNTVLENKIEKGTFGLLYPVGRADLLANAIDMLLIDTRLSTQYKTAGFERARDFDQTKIAQQYLESFNEEV